MHHYCENLQKFDGKFRIHIFFSVIGPISTIGKNFKNNILNFRITIVKTFKNCMKISESGIFWPVVPIFG